MELVDGSFSKTLHQKNIHQENDMNTSEVSMSFVDGVALLAGTSIGGGFLALPVLAQPMGLAPAFVTLFFCSSLLYLTAVSLLEASSIVIAMKQRHNITLSPGSFAIDSILQESMDGWNFLLAFWGFILERLRPGFLHDRELVA